MPNDYGTPPPRMTKHAAENAAGWGAWGVLAALGALLAAVLLASMAIFGWGLFSRSTADFRGRTGVIEKRADANYRIANYESFYDLCASVQTDETAIEALRAQLGVADKDSIAYTVESGQLAGTITSRAAAINQYNADARKQDTKGHFLASDLPYHLDITAKGTSCVAP